MRKKDCFDHCIDLHFLCAPSQAQMLQNTKAKAVEENWFPL